MDGVIANVFRQPGEYITPGDPAVVRLLVMDKLNAVFNIPVEDTVAIKVGSSARVMLRSSSTTINAAITAIAPTIDGESGTVQVRVELDNPDRRMLAGDRCTLQLTNRPGDGKPSLKSTRRRGGTPTMNGNLSNSVAGSGRQDLNVSIAGPDQNLHGQDSMTPALDEAIARLNKVEELEHAANPAIPDIGLALELLHRICAARTRREAVAAMVKFVDANSGACKARGGIGTDKLTRIYDPMLGWLGPESSIHEQLAHRWNTLCESGEDTVDPVPRVLRDARTIEIMLPQVGGYGRVLVWVEGETGRRDSLAWLSHAATTIAAAVWSRPTRAFPAFFGNRLVRRGPIAAAVVCGVLTVAALWPVHYRVACNARVETTAQRLIATPFEATLLETFVKPGDTVVAEDVLLVLDGRPLRLEREAIDAERQQVAKERDVAMATGKVAESQQFALKHRQLSRRYDLISDRLENLEVTSPIAGVVVSGDLDRFVGAPLERGQTLMEVAPMDKLAIEIEIPEYEVGYISEGAMTRVKIGAIGGKSIRLPLISELYPRAELRDEQNVFVGRIDIENTGGLLKPGMLGDATTYGPLRPWFWSWLRSGFERMLWWVGY